jgi:hypothetical protein
MVVVKIVLVFLRKQEIQDVLVEIMRNMNNFLGKKISKKGRA